jgi:hypothetical protein
VLPTSLEQKAITLKVSQIVAAQKKSPKHDYRPGLLELDELIFDLYQLSSAERVEVKTWYQRRYPALFGVPDVEDA